MQWQTDVIPVDRWAFCLKIICENTALFFILYWTDLVLEYIINWNVYPESGIWGRKIVWTNFLAFFIFEKNNLSDGQTNMLEV